MQQLRLHVGDGSQPQLALRQRAGGEEVVLDREATATDTDLLATCRPLGDVDLQQHDPARLVLVDDHLAAIPALWVQLAVQRRGDDVVVMVKEIPRHEAPAGRSDASIKGPNLTQR